jgi:hypothetical protein
MGAIFLPRKKDPPKFDLSLFLPNPERWHGNGEIEVVPVVIYPVDLQHDCKFLYQLNPLPEWGRCWRDFKKEGDWRDALYPIGNGVKQASRKRVSDGLRSRLLE